MQLALHETTRQRYLTYALSVITTRALPDVRDGFKPVQRRILYAMDFNLGLRATERFRKSAAVVGEVMAKYHPHGDSSIYEAMVRMAQPFSLRHPLVDGQGNFGSLDGDSAAAMRYTESRLTPIAATLLDEVTQGTVEMRASYDGQHDEPLVLPVQFPNLLVNGAEGIAVGMATKIPPHNLREVIDACVAMIDLPTIEIEALCSYIKGPDFPTGGIILDDPASLRAIYQEGSGSVQVQARWNTESRGRKHHVVVSEIPYGINKASLVERIGEIVAERKLPQIVDVRDESTEKVRIVLELREAGDAEAAMAYLFRHTPLQTAFHANMTCLVPVEGVPFPTPIRADLRTILRSWLDFRLQTVRRRLQHELCALRDRTHALTALEVAFKNAAKVLRIVQEADDRADARGKLRAAFHFDEGQADRVLDLQVHRLSKMPIQEIRAELEAKHKQVRQIEATLTEAGGLWRVVRAELLALRDKYGDKRRTTFAAAATKKVEYDKAAYILAEDTYIVLTRDGWVKRQGTMASVDKIRTRDGDEVRWVLQGNTRQTLTVFTDMGSAYSIRADQLPSTAGYGEPILKHFKLSDGEKLIGAALTEPTVGTSEEAPHGVALTSGGRVIRFPLATHAEPSTKTGRKYAKCDEGDSLLSVWPSLSDSHVCVVTKNGRGLCFPAGTVPAVMAAGKGVTAIKLAEGDVVIAGEVCKAGAGPTVTLSNGQTSNVVAQGTRASKGTLIDKSATVTGWVRTVAIIKEGCVT